MGLHKILKIIAFALAIIGAILVLVIMAGDEDTALNMSGNMLYVTYATLGIVILLVLIYVLKGLMAKRAAPEVNAGSMADIAFLLLIFFLVTTTIETDSGINRKLPPMEESDEDVIIKQKNIFTVILNGKDQLLVEDEIMELKDLRKAAKEFLDNGGDKTCDFCSGKKDPSFMVATVMRQNTLKIENKLPFADQVDKLDKKDLVMYIYAGKPSANFKQFGTQAKIQLNDNFADINEIASFIASERASLYFSMFFMHAQEVVPKALDSLYKEDQFYAGVT